MTDNRCRGDWLFYCISFLIMGLVSFAAWLLVISHKLSDYVGWFMLLLVIPCFAVSVGMWRRRRWSLWLGMALLAIGGSYTLVRFFQTGNTTSILAAAAILSGIYWLWKMFPTASDAGHLAAPVRSTTPQAGDDRPPQRHHVVSPSLFLSPPQGVADTADFDDDEDDDDDEELEVITLDTVVHQIRMVEDELAGIDVESPLQRVIGRDLLSQIDAAESWLTASYEAMVADAKVQVIYVEMNRFDINTDEWFADCFGFESMEAAAEDLGDYDAAAPTPFVLRGTEDLQQAFADSNKRGIGPGDPQWQLYVLAYFLLTLRMQELMLTAHQQALRHGAPVAQATLLVNSHDSQNINAISQGRAVSSR